MQVQVQTEKTVAAQISYRRADPGDATALGLEAPDGTVLDILEIESLDGRLGFAAHYRPGNPRPDAPLVLSLHGGGGSITRNPMPALSEGLSGTGYPVLAVNSRQAGDGFCHDNYYACVSDLDAAFQVARHLGYERIVLQGHSIGSNQVLYFAATHWTPRIRGVVLTGMFADLGWKSRYVLINDEGTYQRLHAEAAESVRVGDYDRVLSTELPIPGNHPSSRMTAEHFLTYRANDLAGTRSLDWAPRVPYPILMISDKNETVIAPFEPAWLQSSASSGLSPSVQLVQLDSEPGTDGHAFEGSAQELIDTVLRWLADLE